MKARPPSRIAPDWWDYTTLEPELIHEAAALTAPDIARLARPGFRVVMYDSLEEFYLAEALEYIDAWKQAKAGDPVGICGPIGPTEQLPLVAQLVNELGLDLRHAHFWGMDEWCENGREVPATHPLSFERADRELCFDRIRPDLRMPDANLHFPKADVSAYVASWDTARCAVMQGGRAAPAPTPPPRRPPPNTAASAPAWWTCIPSRSCRTRARAAVATWPSCPSRRSRSARGRPGGRRRCRSGTRACTTIRSANG
jgi:hypothetical protein